VRQHPQTIPAVAIALERDAFRLKEGTIVERAVEVIECLAGRGFEIVPKPLGKDWKEVEAQGQVERLRAADLGLSRPAGSAYPAVAAQVLETCEALARLHGLLIRADGTVTPLDKAAVEAGMIAIVERDIGPVEVKLEPGRIEELPAGAKVSPPASGPDEEPEKDNWGVCCRLANDMAARHGCRVELTGRDDPANPNTYYDDNATYAVVTDRSTGRLVGLVECWDTEDGDPIVPRSWLKAVLLAWRAEGTPKRAA